MYTLFKYDDLRIKKKDKTISKVLIYISLNNITVLNKFIQTKDFYLLKYISYNIFPLLNYLENQQRIKFDFVT